MFVKTLAGNKQNGYRLFWLFDDIMQMNYQLEIVFIVICIKCITISNKSVVVGASHIVVTLKGKMNLRKWLNIITRYALLSLSAKETVASDDLKYYIGWMSANNKFSSPPAVLACKFKWWTHTLSILYNLRCSRSLVWFKLSNCWLDEAFYSLTGLIRIYSLLMQTNSAFNYNV